MLPIHRTFGRPPRDRQYVELEQVKLLCDKYYRNPPVSLNHILNGRLHMIYIINIDDGKVIEMDVESYLQAIGNMMTM
jgi:hypothetical protein